MLIGACAKQPESTVLLEIFACPMLSYSGTMNSLLELLRAIKCNAIDHITTHLLA